MKVIIMDWNLICNDPTLQDIPYKIETNAKGQIVMSPASNEHGIYQAMIINMLFNSVKPGIVISECSVLTNQGVKVADVAWASREFFKKYGMETPCNVAPDLCVEIISPSNTVNEMLDKTDLYLAKGAKEVWIVNAKGELHIFDNAGKIRKSKLFPNFPKKISYQINQD
jgi:Uma2 family endonuclease